MIRKLTTVLIPSTLLLIVSSQSLIAAPYNPTPSDTLRNTAGGFNALRFTSGNDNTGFGYATLASNGGGSYNTAFGTYALSLASVSYRNSAFSSNALYANKTGGYNTAIGQGALYRNTTGTGNNGLGYQALVNSTTGLYNIALGYNAGSSLTAGSYNIYLGNIGAARESSTIRIGSTSQTRTFIAGIRGRTTGIRNAVAVYIDGNGQLGTASSSEKYKKDIKDMSNASRGLLQLRPVTYRYKQPDESGVEPLEHGLIAEEVAKIYPDLVVYDAEGKIETVQYHKLTPMLLNELQQVTALVESEKLKGQQQEQVIRLQAQAIEQLKNQITNLQSVAQRMDALTARLTRFEAQQAVGMIENNPPKTIKNPG